MLDIDGLHGVRWLDRGYGVELTIGIKGVTFIPAEGMGLGEEQRAKSMEAAKAEIRELVA
jgi:FMN-dependent NADH-azoreductase